MLTSLVLCFLVAANGMSDPRSLLSAAVQREASLPPGRVTMLVAYPPSGVAFWAESPESGRASLTLKVSWQTSLIFRIDIYDGDSVLRSIVCDGKYVDTGNNVLWDVRFLSQWVDVADSKRGMEFYNLIWPYRLFRMHFFPLSILSSDQALGKTFLNLRMAISLSSTAAAPQQSTNEAGLVEVEIACPVIPDSLPAIAWRCLVDTERGHVITRFLQEDTRDNTILERYEYADMFQVREGLWIPRTLEYRMPDLPEEALVVTSTAPSAQIDLSGPPDIREFTVDRGMNQEVVEWKRAWIWIRNLLDKW